MILICLISNGSPFMYFLATCISFLEKKNLIISLFFNQIIFCYLAVLVSYVLWILTPNQKDDMQFFFFHSVSCLFHCYCFSCFLCFWYHGHKLLQIPMLSSFFHKLSSRSFMSSYLYVLIYLNFFLWVVSVRSQIIFLLYVAMHFLLHKTSY